MLSTGPDEWHDGPVIPESKQGCSLSLTRSASGAKLSCWTQLGLKLMCCWTKALPTERKWFQLTWYPRFRSCVCVGGVRRVHSGGKRNSVKQFSRNLRGIKFTKVRKHFFLRQ